MLRAQREAWLPLESRLVTLAKVAQKCGSAVSLNELSLLLPAGRDMDAPTLRGEILANPALAGTLTVVEGYVGLKGDEARITRVASKRVEHLRSVLRASKAASRAAQHVSGAIFVGISGSVAFGSPSENDDIDLFIVAPRRRLWIHLFQTFLTVKALNLKSRIDHNPTRLCLSFALDEDACREEFSRNRTPMFAREALNVIPIKNPGFYTELLRANTWMQPIFPKLYRSRTHTTQNGHAYTERKTRGAALFDMVDAAIYCCFGLYVKIRSQMKKLALRRKKHHEELFDVSLSRSRWLFPHTRYSKLANFYHYEAPLAVS